MSRFYRGTMQVAAIGCFLLLLTAGIGCKGVDFFWFEVRDLDGKTVYTVHPCIDLKGLEAKSPPAYLQASKGPGDAESAEEVPGMRGKDSDKIRDGK